MTEEGKREVLSPRVAWAIAVVATAAVTGLSLVYLHDRWISLDRAVFEADVYAQGIAHALHGGALWPWNLTAEFWPFLTMAPGIYLFIPIFAVFKGGYATLVTQALGLGAGALLVHALAQRRTQGGWAPPLLALAWLAHPMIAVGMGWGWSFYAFGAPLTLAGYLLLDTRKWGWAALVLLLAASMKVNVALIIAGLGLWGLFRDDRPWGLPVLMGMGAWVATTGTLLLAGLMAEGRLSHDLHLGGGQKPETAGAILTLAVTLIPLAPLLRHTWPLALLAAGLELLYTGAFNPANSGLIPAVAALFIAACEGLRLARHPERLAGAALTLSIVGRLAFNPPVVGPLPLTPAAFAYQVDEAGAEARALAESAPPDSTLVVNEPMMGTIGRHPGPVMRPEQWSGKRPAVVLVQASAPPAGTRDCTRAVRGEADKTLWFGLCP